MEITEILLRVLVFLAGAFFVASIMLSAIRSFVLPRSARDWLTSIVFLGSRRFFDLLLLKADSYEKRDRVMALYAPITLVALPVVWLSLTLLSYMVMYWAVGATSLDHAFIVSGSSLLTLGFEKQEGLLATALAFSEAAIGLILIALLIAYLPTMYTAFSKRESYVTLLEVRVGEPPSPVTLFSRLKRLERATGRPMTEDLHQIWTAWEGFFAELEETHTSLAPLSFFRSPRPQRSWITSVGAVLDSAALASSTLDLPADPQAQLTIRAGFLALRHIADFFQIPHNPDPKPDDQISISRVEFNTLCDELEANGIPLKADRDEAWQHYAGWRVNYDTVLLALCALMMPPYAPWSSDRSLRRPDRARWRHKKAASVQRDQMPSRS